ncbi:alpha-ketoglutarate-dependent dioxygenase AlkB [Blastococcus saxobsidens]|uniref:Alkylated DNA repair dioxygenase AlkB n=1 Tax=Blastococcus saxobsidens TaxID=138336 RepID=A0A4Q7Y6H1_9ACTN|nr:alpha-ketoglutarate-dependent dioxygenase AlkB [Blastococcus saxobsidens]RZU31753.1 alkylated DNA repair dioxygenase AlkB [Blastococcus saxobsidens]
MGRMRGIWQRPEGLVYLPDLLLAPEEGEFLSRMAGEPYGEVRLHGQVARRTVRHYGVSYDFEAAEIAPADPLPEWLAELRRRCADLLATADHRLAECLLTRYPAGATIGWHRDAPVSGDVVGVSLRSACLLRFQRGQGAERRVFEQALEPRSTYALTGPSRTAWQHSIPAVREERYSITFRTISRRSLSRR